MPMAVAPLLALVLLAASAAWGEASGSESETIWLRGRGSDVWIERRAAVREPRDERKDVTRVATSPNPAVKPGATSPRADGSAGPGAASDGRGAAAVVVLDAPHWAHEGHTYEHDYSPRFYYPPYSYRLYPVYGDRYGRGRPWGRPHSGYGGFGRYGHGRYGHGGSFSSGHHGHASHGRPGRFDAGQRHGPWAGGPVYRNAGPYGGSARTGGYVVRGGAYRRVR